MSIDIQTQSIADETIASAHELGRGLGQRGFHNVAELAMAVFPKDIEAQIAYIDGFVTEFTALATAQRQAHEISARPPR